MAGFFGDDIGAKIERRRQPDDKNKGVNKQKGGEYKIIPDRIDAGTFAILAAASNSGEVLIKNCNPGHLEALWSLFDKIGINYVLERIILKLCQSKNFSLATL